jgi:hypothetical protein
MDTETRMALLEAEQKRQKIMLDGNGKIGLYDMCNETHRTVQSMTRKMNQISGAFFALIAVVAGASVLAYLGIR